MYHFEVRVRIVRRFDESVRVQVVVVRHRSDRARELERERERESRALLAPSIRDECRCSIRVVKVARCTTRGSPARKEVQAGRRRACQRRNACRDSGAVNDRCSLARQRTPPSGDDECVATHPRVTHCRLHIPQQALCFEFLRCTRHAVPPKRTLQDRASRRTPVQMRSGDRASSALSMYAM